MDIIERKKAEIESLQRKLHRCEQVKISLQMQIQGNSKPPQRGDLVYIPHLGKIS